MLILTRKPGESLYVITNDGHHIKVTVVEIKGNQIRLGIDAPNELRIYREEIYQQILEENKKAALGVPSDDSLEQLSGGWKGMSQGNSGDGKGVIPKRVSIGGGSCASRGSGTVGSNGVSVTGSTKVGSKT